MFLESWTHHPQQSETCRSLRPGFGMSENTQYWYCREFCHPQLFWRPQCAPASHQRLVHVSQEQGSLVPEGQWWRQGAHTACDAGWGGLGWLEEEQKCPGGCEELGGEAPTEECGPEQSGAGCSCSTTARSYHGELGDDLASNLLICWR